MNTSGKQYEYYERPTIPTFGALLAEVVQLGDEGVQLVRLSPCPIGEGAPRLVQHHVSRTNRLTLLTDLLSERARPRATPALPSLPRRLRSACDSPPPPTAPTAPRTAD